MSWLISLFSSVGSGMVPVVCQTSSFNWFQVVIYLGRAKCQKEWGYFKKGGRLKYQEWGQTPLLTVVTERYSQDQLEKKYFGRKLLPGAFKVNPLSRNMWYNDNSIQNQTCISYIARNALGNDSEILNSLMNTFH